MINTTRRDRLKPISREHHFGLLFCWRIRQGLSRQVNAERITRYIRYFWKENLSPHFQEEEMLLLEDRTDPLVRKTVEDHVLIQREIEEVSRNGNDCSPVQLNKLIDRFNEHILFEENVLFPHLQRKLRPDQFQKIDARFQESTGAQLKNIFEDQFWRDPKSSL